MAASFQRVPCYNSSGEESSEENEPESQDVEAKSKNIWEDMEEFENVNSAMDYLKVLKFVKRSTNPANEETERKVIFFKSRNFEILTSKILKFVLGNLTLKSMGI